MARSRLSRKSRKKSTQTLVLSILGIAAILFLLFRYGIPLISDASFLFGRITSSPISEESSDEEKEGYVSVPRLDTLPRATKEQDIKVTGTSVPGFTVSIYLNGSKDDETQVLEDGTFEFNVRLSEGENIIRAKAKKEDLESDFSNTVTISYVLEGPELSIDSPSDNAEIRGQNPIEIRGKTDPDVRVTVNDFQAVSGSDGSYSYLLTLKSGNNEIKVVATDAAGNKTEKIIRVNYSQ